MPRLLTSDVHVGQRVDGGGEALVRRDVGDDGDQVGVRELVAELGDRALDRARWSGR